MQSLLPYSKELEEDERVRFLEWRVMDIVNDRMSSRFLTIISIEKYLRYTRVDQMEIKRQGIYDFLVKLGRDVLAVVTLGSTHLDETSLIPLLRKTSSSCSRPTIRSITTSTSLSHITQLFFKGTPRPSFISLTLDACIKTKSSFRSFHCFWHHDLATLPNISLTIFSMQ